MGNARRYAIPIILWVVTLALLVVGVLSVTVWKPQQEVLAEYSSDQPYSATRAGLLPLYADKVEVRATGEPEQMVWLVLGSPEDVTAWLADDPYDEIVGLSDIETLKAITHLPEIEESEESEEDEVAEEGEEPAADDSEDGEESGQAAQNPLESDMWTVMKYGVGSVSMTLEGDELNMAAIAATDGQSSSPTLSLRWETPQGNLLALISFTSAATIGLLAAIMTGITAYAQRKRGAKTDRGAAEVAALSEVEDAVLPVEDSKEPVEQESAVEPSEVPETAGETLEEKPDDTIEADETIERAEDAAAPTEEGILPESEEDTTETDKVPLDAEKTPPVTPVAIPAAQSTSDDGQVTETVTTESGMMNLSALQTGGAFPTRRALREARDRGVDALIVGDSKYPVDTHTGVPIKPENAADRTQTWASAVDSISSEEANEEGR